MSAATAPPRTHAVITRRSRPNLDTPVGVTSRVEGIRAVLLSQKGRQDAGPEERQPGRRERRPPLRQRVRPQQHDTPTDKQHH